MEKLPDELWLSVFIYLHKFDILYSFHSLNLRFQKLIGSYESNINLSDFSYKLFNRFCREILPIHGHDIHYLTIKGTHQLNFFRENSTLLQRMDCLQCLTLIGRQYSIELIDFYVKHFPLLNTFRIKLINYGEQRLEDILSSNLLLITNLSLLEGNEYYFDGKNIVKQPGTRLSRLKTLTIQNLKTTSDLYYLFEMMFNLEELNLSVNQFDSQPLLNSVVPKCLTMMNLELNCTLHDQQTIEMLREFLFLFRKQLKSLKLVIYCTDKSFDIEFYQNLKENLPYLVSFAYSVEILDPPRPPLPTEDTDSDRLAMICEVLFPKMTFQRLQKETQLVLGVDDQHSQLESLILSDGKSLPKLRTVFIFGKFRNSDADMIFYSKLLSISPNVTRLEVTHSSSTQTIDLLSKLPITVRRMIKNLKCSNCYKECTFEFHLTFLFELSQILPNLRDLILFTIMPGDNTTETILTPKLAIEHSRKYCKRLIHLRMKLKVGSHYGENVAGLIAQKMGQELEVYLKDDQCKDLFYEDVFKDGHLYILDVWL